MNKYILILTILTTATLTAAQTPTPSPDALTVEKQRADRLQTRLNEYANYGRYADANSKLSPPAKGEDRVVFMGDSITDGWKLADLFPGKPYVNRGISGQTTSQMLIRFRPDVIALQPKVVVILAGTNDIAGNTGPISIDAIAGNLESMVELAHANGINVVLSSVMPVSDYSKNAQGNQIVQTVRRPPAKILELNDRIKKLCAEHKLVYLDYFSAMVDDKGLLKEDVSYDGLHANAKGYSVMTATAAPAIATALKMKRPR